MPVFHSDFVQGPPVQQRKDNLHLQEGSVSPAIRNDKWVVDLQEQALVTLYR